MAQPRKPTKKARHAQAAAGSVAQCQCTLGRAGTHGTCICRKPCSHLHAAHVCGVVQRLEADLAARRAQRVQHASVAVHSRHCHVGVALQAAGPSRRHVAVD